MTEAYLAAIDPAKRHFQVRVLGASGKTLFNRAFSRQTLQEVLGNLTACIVAMEACATSHYRGRIGLAAGHEVRLIPGIMEQAPPESRITERIVSMLNLVRLIGQRYPAHPDCGSRRMAAWPGVQGHPVNGAQAGATAY